MNADIANLIVSPAGEALQYFNNGKNEYLQSPEGKKYLIEHNIIHFLDNVILTGNNKLFQKLYNRLAVFYDLVTGFYAKVKSVNEKNRLMEYLSLLNVNDNDKVIEVSIGTGRNIKYLNPQAEYFGVDISLGMLRQCHKNMEPLNRKIILIYAEAENLPIKDNSFDVVFSAGGFNFFNDPKKAMNEMLRIAKQGSKILVTDETEKFRQKHKNHKFYKNHKIKNPIDYLPEHCINIEYKEICNDDLYVLSFYKQ